MMTTAQVAEKLGVTSASVTAYVRAGLLRTFMGIKTRPMLFAGEEVLTFKRTVFPLITRGRGHRYPSPTSIR